MQPENQDIQGGPVVTEEYKPRDLSSMPYGTPQPDQPVQPTPAPVNDSSKKSPKFSKGPVIAGIVGGVVVLVLIIVAVLAGSNKSNQTQKPTTPDSTQSQALQPAQSVELEQTSNALSQDLSGLDDEKDLPNNSLEDTTLGL